MEISIEYGKGSYPTLTVNMPNRSILNDMNAMCRELKNTYGLIKWKILYDALRLYYIKTNKENDILVID